MDIKKGVGQKIQDIRKSKGITQEQLAEAVGLETVSISKIETGRSYPTSENLSKIAEILSVHPKDLYDFSYKKPKDKVLKEIFEKINKLSNSEKKLNLIYNIINAIE